MNANRKSRWESIAKLFRRFSGLLRFIFVALLLAAGWYGFLRLVNKPPLPETPVLVMVWGTVIVLLLSAFPEVLRRIKKLKVSDFEVELQEAVEETSTKNRVSLEELRRQEEFIYKGSLHSLPDILDHIMDGRSRPFVLVVNIDSRISKQVLGTYLFFLDISGKPFVVLFIKGDQIALDALTKRDVIGVISGREALRQLTIRYPRLYQNLYLALSERVQDFDNRRDVFYRDAIFETARNVAETPAFREYNREDRLSGNDLRDWFGNRLSTYQVDLNAEKPDAGQILGALERGEEYLLAFEGSVLHSIIPICDYTKQVTQRVAAASK